MIRRSGGFTLIEVLVALVIVGMALPALLLRMQGILDNTAYMNEKTHAYWFAENKMQELLIRHKLQGDVVKNKKTQDQEEFAGQKWYWRVTVQDTEAEKMHRVEVAVGLTDEVASATIAGFLYE